MVLLVYMFFRAVSLTLNNEALCSPLGKAPSPVPSSNQLLVVYKTSGAVPRQFGVFIGATLLQLVFGGLVSEVLWV